MKEYCIWIDQQPIPVSEDVYKAYWKGERKERYFIEGDIHNRIFYYDALDTEETNGSEIFSDTSDTPVEDQVIKNIETHRLYDALHKLPEKDFRLIERLYFYGDSLRSISRKADIPLSTLYYRHKQILQKLKEILCTSQPY